MPTASLAEACGFNQDSKRRRGTPSQSALNRFKHRVGPEGFKALFEELVQQLLDAGVARGRWVAVDSTALKAYFRADPDARHGFRAKDKPFYGYKLHLIVDVESELPVAFRVTPGNVHDSRAYLGLLEDLEAQGLSPERVYGDGAYDAAELRRITARLLGADLEAPRNPRRRGGRAEAPRLLQRRRSSVERAVGRLKTLLGLGGLKVRRLRSVVIHILLALIAMLVVAASAAAHQLPAEIRSLRSLFA